MAPIPVTALKNWLVCPRQVLYSHGLGIVPPVTFKMREGRIAQQEWERLEFRRTLDRYGLSGRTRLAGLQLVCEELGISGSPDLVLKGPNAAAIIECKLSAREFGPPEWMQLACYAALVEKRLQVKVDWLFGYRIPDGHLNHATYTDAWRARTLAVLQELRLCLESQTDPGPPASRDLCPDCSYANYCGDVW